jgi:hypothetical protein
MISASACSSDYGVKPVGSNITAYFVPSSSGLSSGPVTLQKNSINGDIVEVDVKISKVNSVFGASIKIAYDAKKLNWTGSYRKGDFLEKGSTLPSYQAALDGDSGEGRLIIGVSLIPPAVPISGSGTIITIPFKVIAKGKSTISLYDSIVADSSANAIATITDYKAGTITGF